MTAINKAILWHKIKIDELEPELHNLWKEKDSYLKSVLESAYKAKIDFHNECLTELYRLLSTEADIIKEAFTKGQESVLERHPKSVPVVSQSADEYYDQFYHIC